MSTYVPKYLLEHYIEKNNKWKTSSFKVLLENQKENDIVPRGPFYTSFDSSILFIDVPLFIKIIIIYIKLQIEKR